MKLFLRLSLLFAGLFIFGIAGMNNYLQAQVPTSSPQEQAVTDSVDFALLPALAYNSDFGLISGGIVSRHHYKDNTIPFYSYLTIYAMISTKGLISFNLLYDKPKLLDTKLRLSSEVYVSRFFQNQYYGIGRYGKLDHEPDGNPDYYLYNSFSSGYEFILRRPILTLSETSHLDVYGIVNFDYRTPWGDNEGRRISEDQPRGIDGLQTSAFGGGLIWENRNNEFNPTRGNYLKAGVETGQKMLGSSVNYFVLESEASTYSSFHLVREITFANRLSFTHTYGSLPYWKLAELGGEETMRGYPEHRFRDDNALYLNTELRTWLWEFPQYKIKFGGTLFADIGRTFPNGMALKNVFKDLKYTYGFGAPFSFFNENFILRGDVGFSEEGYGVYFTAGFLF